VATGVLHVATLARMVDSNQEAAAVTPAPPVEEPPTPPAIHGSWSVDVERERRAMVDFVWGLPPSILRWPFTCVGRREEPPERWGERTATAVSSRRVKTAPALLVDRRRPNMRIQKVRIAPPR
jgi:hypothetical protein